MSMRSVVAMNPTRGFDAWINYCGYRTQEPMEPLEIQLGNRALDTVMPLSVLGRPQIQSATAAD